MLLRPVASQIATRVQILEGRLVALLLDEALLQPLALIRRLPRRLALRLWRGLPGIRSEMRRCGDGCI